MKCLKCVFIGKDRWEEIKWCIPFTPPGLLLAHHSPEGMPSKTTLLLLFALSCCLVATSSLTLCDPVDCSPPASSVHGISQARILEWAAISFSRLSS